MHGELGNRFYLLFCDDREKKTNGKHRETERKNETKNARSKNALVRADATTRLALDRSHLAKNIHSKTRSSRRGEIPGPFPPSLPREMRIILFSQHRKPSSLLHRCACLYKIEKRTRSSSRELHLIPTQVRIRFVHGIRLLFRFSFTHGAMMMRSRGALLVAF